jgi:hypothetical protein
MPIANVGTNLPVYCSTLIFTVVTSMQSLVLVQQKLISRFANSIRPYSLFKYWIEESLFLSAVFCLKELF